MGSVINKLAPRIEESKKEVTRSIIDKSYDTHFGQDEPTDNAVFYRAVCQIVEDMNIHYGHTQLNVPKQSLLKEIYKKHHYEGRGKMTKDEFDKSLQEVIARTRFSGVGAKDTLIYIFGVPATTLFIKEALIPNAISNDYFITGITSATVLVLAKLNKI